MSQHPLKATTLRKILITAMVVVVLGVIGGFYLGLQVIREYAVEVSHTTEDVNASDGQVKQLQVLRNKLVQVQGLVEKADKIFATDASYQAQAITDLQRYAEVAGISITKTDFTQPEGQIATQRVVKISLAQPVSYEKLLRFFQLIEGSIPKMQVTNTTIGRPATPTGDQVTVEDITIRIEIK